MDLTWFLMYATSWLSLSTLRMNLSIFLSKAWNAAGSIGGAAAVCVLAEVPGVGVVGSPLDCPAALKLLGPGRAAEAGSTVPAVAGATWGELVDVVVVAVVGNVGPPCGEAHHAPEARSAWYFRAIRWNPDCTCRMCWYLIARLSKSCLCAALMFAAVKRKGNYLP
ncbi:hypothetical protein NDU88_003754 [Pleurodeles waltl]|uniref:Secreted protein n=1 Tax=Pleurodeles waltl TaxID=8319 RepID=A0AAV7RGR7_PLEWA|nr:hypothetical protein NDU88_003754 [Pleurodeles waltl]